MNNFKSILLNTVLFSLVFAGLVAGERLPTVSGDLDNWGTVLNSYLSVALNSSSGYLKVGSINDTFVGVGNLTAAVFATGSVNTSAILNSNVTADDLAPLSINTTHIFLSNITAGLIAPAAVNGTGIGQGVVNQTHLSGSIINGTHIAFNVVNASHVTFLGSDDINLSSINASHILPAAVNSTHIVDATVTTTDIADSTLNISDFMRGSSDNPAEALLNGSDSGGVLHINQLARLNSTVLILNVSDGGGIDASVRFIEFYNASSLVGAIQGTGTPGTLAYTTFTGAHYSETDEKNLVVGELLISTGELMKNTRELTKSARTNKRRDSRIYGVYGGVEGPASKFGLGEKEIIQVVALGTAGLLVTDTNGNIENGDLITTSTRSGYGEKQGEDIIRSYTVAKATQNVNWKDVPVDPVKGFKSKMITANLYSG